MDRQKAQEEAALEGFFYAVGLFNRLHDKPALCAGVIKEAYLETVDCKDFDEFEKEQLRIINKEPGMGLLGL